MPNEGEGQDSFRGGVRSGGISVVFLFLFVTELCFFWCSGLVLKFSKISNCVCF